MRAEGFHFTLEEGADGSWPVHSWGIQVKGNRSCSGELKGLVFHLQFAQ